jgi:NAD(P)-dependent dehydrogenase (short-subunit alcohol dehydrogenase family)
LSYIRRLDYACNNAGIEGPSPTIDYREEDWDTVIDINLKGTWPV